MQNWKTCAKSRHDEVLAWAAHSRFHNSPQYSAKLLCRFCSNMQVLEVGSPKTSGLARVSAVPKVPDLHDMRRSQCLSTAPEFCVVFDITERVSPSLLVIIMLTANDDPNAKLFFRGSLTSKLLKQNPARVPSRE